MTRKNFPRRAQLALIACKSTPARSRAGTYPPGMNDRARALRAQLAPITKYSNGSPPAARLDTRLGLCVFVETTRESGERLAPLQYSPDGSSSVE